MLTMKPMNIIAPMATIAAEESKNVRPGSISSNLFMNI